MSKIANIKKQIVNNRQTIIYLTAIAGTVAITTYSIVKTIKNVKAASEFAEYLNAGLADGSLTMIVQDGIGLVDIVETASL